MAAHDQFKSRIFSLSPEKRALLEQQLLKRMRAKAAVDPLTTGLVAASGEIVRRPRQAGACVFPLSFAQERLWFFDQLEPGTAVYNMAFAVRLRDPLRLDYLQQSLRQVCSRHESLRTSFSSNEAGDPIQVINDACGLELQVIDLSDMSAALCEGEMRRLLAAEAQRPFDLAHAPLVRATVLRLSEQEHVFLLTMHHIISDGWSLEILFRETSACYESLVQHRPCALPELPIQYADFAVWQRDVMRGQHLDKQLAYWRQQLQNAPVALDLPTDYPRPSIQTFPGALESLVLPANLHNAIKDFCRREQATLYMLLLVAFQALLQRYTGQEDLVVGTPIAGRSRSEVEGLVGCFVNTLALRCDLSGDPTVRELLARVRNTALEAYAHQDLPFEKLVSELNPERQLSHAPLFQAMLILQNVPNAEMKLADLQATPIEISNGTAKFDLSLCLFEKPDGLRAGLTYNADLFRPATIARMLGHYQMMLKGMTAHPDQHLSQLQLLSPHEERQLLVSWNNTRVEFTADECIHTLFEEQVQRTPDSVALVFDQEQLTYSELNLKANQLAHFLRKRGIGPDSRVALCVERSAEMVVALLAILKSGGAYVPLDPAYPQERISFMGSHARAPILLTQRNLAQRWSQFDGEFVCLDEDWPEISKEAGENLSAANTPQNLAYVIYTSGSTGKPKGVQLEHRNVVNFLRSVQRYVGLTQEDVFLGVASMSFDASVLDFFLPLTVGARLVVVSREVLMDGHALAHVMHARDVTAMHATPSTWRMLLEAGWSGTDRLKILSGGEALPWEQAQELLKRSGVLWNLYGPTETAVYSAIHQVRSGDGTVLIGRPIANTQIYLLDSRLQPVPAGVPGELFIGGAGVARGYLNRPELTAERFIADPFSPTLGCRLYRTGDLARYREDGSLQYLGRLDFQVKIRGFRIELEEIETVLSGHSGIQQAVVVAAENVPGNKRLVAYLIARDTGPGAAELRESLKQKLPEYMVPSAFIYLEKMPLSASGKVDRKTLQVMGAGDRQEPETAYIEPGTPTEELVAAIWADVLNVEGVGVHDNFFDLGGHSLLATRIISRLRHSFQIELPLRALFECPTVAALAKRIEAFSSFGHPPPTPPLLPVPRDGSVPLSFAQQRLWFLDQLEPNSAQYNVPRALRLRGGLNKEALRWSLGEILRRHEPLRSTFVVREDGPVQVISPAAQIDLPITDLACVAEGERNLEAERLARKELQRPFDLSQGPLLRAHLLRLSEEEHILLLTMHHIVSDAWSAAILSRELSIHYSARLSGLPPHLPELPVQYADFAAWQRHWLQGEVLQQQLEYWRKQLEGAPSVLHLPTDRPRPAVPTYRGAGQRILLSRELSEGVKALSRREGVTLFMTLLAAFQVLLARYSGQEDIVVGSPIANRRFHELEGLIGLFANTLAMRTDLSGDPSFRKLLSQVRDTALAAYAHQDLPFEKLVEELQPERSLSFNPLFQVMFTLQNTPVVDQEMPPLKVERLPLDTGTAKFDLILFVVETGNGLQCRIEYSTDLYESATIERMLKHFQVLLQGVLDDVSQPISQLALLTPAERRQVVVEFNDTKTEHDRDRCIHELFEEQVGRSPDAIAVVHENQRLTYQELNNRANQLAHYLRKHGVRIEMPVGVCAERSLEMIVAILAVLKAGGAYVPLDPAYPNDRLGSILQDTKMTALLGQQPLVTKLPMVAERVLLDRDWPRISAESCQNLGRTSSPDNLAYVLFTSGSTGRPKGVAIEHRNAITFIEWAQTVFTAEDLQGVLFSTSICFDLSIFEMFVTLSAGGKVIIAQDALQLPTLPSANEVTLINTVPSAIAELVRLGGIPSSVRTINLAGEPLPYKLVQQIYDSTRVVQVFNLYGPTEDTTYSTFAPIARGAHVTIGNPISNTQAYILDRFLQPLPIGVAGELYLGGEGLARGYFGQPDLTAQRFVHNPFSTTNGARLYRTGDLARFLPDGNIEYLGRIDNQVKLRGFRIELGEIETVLAGHPAVKEAVVVVREDHPDDKRLVAYVVPTLGHTPNASELRNHVKQKLPEYMVPAGFVALDRLPFTPNGKVNRRGLPAPQQSALAFEEGSAALNPIEEVVAGIWAEVLHLERVGVKDDFFEVGGHSLLATQVIARVRRVFQVELPLRSMFEARTIVEMANRIDAALGSQPDIQTQALVPICRDGALPLSFAQQRLWFLDQFNSNHSLYNVAQAIRLKGVLQPELLRQSLNQIVRRHEILRTSFTTLEDQPVQIVVPDCNLQVPIVDLSEFPESARETEAQRLAREEGSGSFVLAQPPLLRVKLLRFGAQDHVLLVTMHHIVSDAWSTAVLVRELSTLYTAFVSGQPSPLPELSIQYGDFAVWQRQWLQGDVLARQLEYWRTQLEGAPPLLQLPTDRPRPSHQTYSGARRTATIPKPLTEAVQRLSRLEGTTLFMTMLAAFQVLLARYSGQKDLVIGTDLANRTHVETEGLIGFFVNLVPLRLRLQGDPSFRELLQQVRDAALGAYAHQDMPFDKLVEDLRLERSAAYNPLVQVLFVQQNTPRSLLKLAGLEGSSFGTHVESSKFDLAVFMVEGEQGLSASWVYKTDLFDSATVARMAAHYESLLGSIVARPDSRLSLLDFLTEEEKTQQTREQRERRESKRQKLQRVTVKPVSLTPHSAKTTPQVGD